MIFKLIAIRNWLFGFYIVEFEQNGEARAEFGQKLLSKISNELKNNSLKAVSLRELRNYRRFYHTYPQIRRSVTSESQNNPIWRTLSSKLQLIDNLETNIEKTENNKIEGLDVVILITRLSYTHFEELVKITNFK